MILWTAVCSFKKVKGCIYTTYTQNERTMQTVWNYTFLRRLRVFVTEKKNWNILITRITKSTDPRHTESSAMFKTFPMKSLLCDPWTHIVMSLCLNNTNYGISLPSLLSGPVVFFWTSRYCTTRKPLYPNLTDLLHQSHNFNQQRSVLSLMFKCACPATCTSYQEQ